MKFLVRTGLVTGVGVVVLALASALWAEYSARGSCTSVGGPAALSRIVGDGAPATLVDEALPEYQIGEKHSIFIDAPPERVFESLERDTGGEHPILELFDLLKVFGEGAPPLSSKPKSRCSTGWAKATRRYSKSRAARGSWSTTTRAW